MVILIDRVGDEIHVSVPFHLKDRVKKIAGYRWDPSIKIWVFSFSDEVFAQLKSEFGKDAIFSGFEFSESPGLPSFYDDPFELDPVSPLRRDLKVLKDSLLEARDRIENLERDLANERLRSKKLIESECVLTPDELEFLRSHRKLVLEQARKDRPISW